MSKKQTYDLCVVGAGPGGYVAAIRAAQLGLSVALVERRNTFGGTCLNVGCIPSKALLDSSERLVQIRDEAGHHGIKVGNIEVDLSLMMGRKDAVVKQLTNGVSGLLKHHGIETFEGLGEVVKPGRVRVADGPDEGQTVLAENLLLATGSQPAELPFLPFDGKTVVDSTGALAFSRVPKTLVVVGGGVIGVEMASIWSRLGAEVTIIELLPRLLPNLDSETSKLLERLLKKQGVAIHTGTGVKEFRKAKGRSGKVFADSGGSQLEFPAEKVLVATGRRPVTTGIDLDALGIECDSVTGAVIVNDSWMTTCAGVYAVGDVIGGAMLAHKAEEEGVAVAENLAGYAGHVNYDTIPWVVYSHPEVAGVGATEDQLKENHVDYRSGRFHFRANGRAIACDSIDGFVKVLAAADGDEVLGVHIVGPSASELIAEAVAVMEFGGSAEDIARTVHAHPTLSEVVKEAALAVDARAIHAIARQ